MLFRDSQDTDASFETFIPESMQTVLVRQTNEDIPIEFGIRITNQSVNSKRFLLFHLTPELLDPYNQSIFLSYARNVTRLIEKHNFIGLYPRESINFLLNGKITVRKSKCQSEFSFLLFSRNGGAWSTVPSQEFGTYKIRFHYKIRYPIHRCYKGKDANKNPVYDVSYSFGDLWTGEIVTAYQEFSLTRKH